MTVRVGSGAPWEAIVGYSRAVAADGHVWVSGCTPIADGDVVHEGDAYLQTVQTLRNVAAALERVGAAPEDVVRTRIFVTDISRWEEYGRAHGEMFGDIRPATSMLQVSALIDPRLLVEIEAVGYRAGLGGPTEEAS
ncbi:enamine deaminase RidA (YjgF/YER057c/UK114 family) [Haloactinopolyspora alba]|uniref:Enamine deaminase RidA (YjgF/YER057c/UK114 family) n=1 Tax=Haloactinopolyspora alba TaxID=648780 RepID=A0A2P8E3Z9_9ACTN|nr:RidA family protein [Haloactinopolyspora alba]PSL04192.1 enamine deaminase RidA (YjgF/YER057c/UK114 family) [Haloactinopolyspora alba]